MKRVLIWDKNIRLSNTGGPSGYLYNLHEYLLNKPNEQIQFYSDIISKGKDKMETVRKHTSGLLSLLNKSKKIGFILEACHLYFRNFVLTEEDRAIINRFDFVHIHSINDMLSSFCQGGIRPLTILTTHTPEPFFDEMVSRYGYTKVFKALPFIRSFFIKRECFAYKEADYIMLPVKEAAEVYTSNSILLKETFERACNKFFYVPTSLFPEHSIGQNQHQLDRYDIPTEAIVLCFIGRHNKVKGYESLKEIANEVWKHLPNVYFVIGGKEEPLTGLKDKRWIELGWVKTPDLLQEVDAFILPNQQTYFDIILLEVLREGKMAIIASTGGNKWFAKHPIEGIWNYDFNDANAVVKICQIIAEIKKENRVESVNEGVKDFCVSCFSAEQFVNSYIKEIEKL